MAENNGFLFGLLLTIYLVIVSAPSYSRAAIVSGEKFQALQQEHYNVPESQLSSADVSESSPEISARDISESSQEMNDNIMPEAEAEQLNSVETVHTEDMADQSVSSDSTSDESSADQSYMDELETLLAPLREAVACDPAVCQPPACRCAATSMDGGKTPSAEIPQLVTLTFDDAVTALNYKYFERALSNRFNPDGCPAAATFFVSHEYTDYSKVHALWAAGHEIALHSVTHNYLGEHWKSITVDGLIAEFGDQLEIMEHFANMDTEEIRGMRMPLFQLSGNNSFDAMRWLGLEYDSSWPSQDYMTAGLWPYSLEYKSIQDCPIGPCPNASLPDVWVNPILDWEDMRGFKCSMVDACCYMPEDSVDAVLEWMIQNFNRTYNSNRAPFGVYLHAAWFEKGKHYFEAYVKFLDYLGELPDVHIVSSHRALQFARNPRAGQPFDDCPTVRQSTCVPKVCALRKEITGEMRWMTSCTTECPSVYPWLGNPTGQAAEHWNKRN